MIPSECNSRKQCRGCRDEPGVLKKPHAKRLSRFAKRPAGLLRPWTLAAPHVAPRFSSPSFRPSTIMASQVSKERRHMIKISTALMVLLLYVVGCTPPVVMLVNPRTGDVRRCSTAEVGSGAHEYAESTRIKSCVHEWKSLGYFETEHLTSEQRSRLASRP